MAIKPLTRKVLKITGITAGILLLLLGGAYWWVVHHAESLLRDIVHTRSKGTVALDLRSVTYNLDNHRLYLRGAVFYNTDSAKTKTAYRVRVNRLSVQLHSLLPLLLRRELSVDSILINEPDISVVKYDTLQNRHGSLTTEIGQFYNSIHKGLSLFAVGYFRIERGRFTLANKARSDWQPVSISNIYFHINNFELGDTRPEDDGKFFFSNNIVFRTDHQQLTFPDGRYSMAFSHFRINVKERVIEMDSCTIHNNGPEVSKTSINLFFDKLRFSGIDLTTLYYNNTLKADSMYALNPKARLKVTINSNNSAEKDPASIDSLLHQLGLNLHIRYMGVRNISTSLAAERHGQTATYQTKGDDFELRDVRIAYEAPEPVSIGGFNMAIRGYSSLTRDSNYIFRFDSVRIINTRVLLNNFSITSVAKAEVKRHHVLPLFELDNLDWEELVFNRHIKARQAILHRPVIHYTRSTRQEKGQHASMYSILHSLSNTMSLERIHIRDGELIYTPNAGIKLQLEHVNLTVSTNQLLSATTPSMLGKAVDSLHFTRGSIHTKKIEATITNGRFKGDSTSLEADEVTLYDAPRSTNVKAKSVRFSGLAFNEHTEDLYIDQASWKEASVSLNHAGTAGQATTTSPLSWQVNRLEGHNTSLTMHLRQGTWNTFLTYIRTDDLQKEAGKAMHLRDISLQGHQLTYANAAIFLQCQQYELSNTTRSWLRNMLLQRYTLHDSLTVTIPEVFLLPDRNAHLENLAASEVTIHHPVVHYFSRTGATSGASAVEWPDLDIQSVIIDQPSLVYIHQHAEGRDTITLNKQAYHSTIALRTINKSHHTPLSVDELFLSAHDAGMIQHGEQPMTIAAGGLQLQLRQLSIDAPGNAWAATIDKAVVGTVALSTSGSHHNEWQADQLTLQNLHMNNRQSWSQWFAGSPTWSVSGSRGSFGNTDHQLHWGGWQYTQQAALLQVDSFAYAPSIGRDAYIAAHPYQTDYIELKTGQLQLSRPALHGLRKDSLIHLGAIRLQSPDIYVFRDKRPPFQSGMIKPLPVNLIRNLPLHLLADTIALHNGSVRYEELSSKTEQTGSITFSQLDAQLTNIRSRGHQPNDSLHLTARAYLLDSMYIRLGLHESYTDSLASFHMTTHISPGSLTVLNKAVEPLASVRIRSGYLDTLTFNAIGREHLSYGQMQMIYRRLQVQLLQARDAERKTFFTRIGSFVANNFVLHRHNQRKTSIVYFERLRDRSIFNYMIKMLLSGASSSMGIRSNKKYLRHYYRELRRQQLPQVQL